MGEELHRSISHRWLFFVSSWPVFSSVPVFAILKIRWMTYSRFCVFLQIRKQTSMKDQTAFLGLLAEKRLEPVAGFLGSLALGPQFEKFQTMP